MAPLETDTGQRARGRTEHNATLKRPAKTRTLHADMYVGTRDPHQTRGTRKRADGAPAVTSGPSRKRQAARQSPRRIQQELPKGYMRVQIHSARLCAAYSIWYTHAGSCSACSPLSTNPSGEVTPLNPPRGQVAHCRALHEVAQGNLSSLGDEFEARI